MNPFFFGSSEHPLFGVFTHGKSPPGPSGSILLCYPIGSEYMRAHRAFRQLNTLLNRAGMNVIRFEYSGTGDSSGDGEDVTVEQWLEDIESAVEELKDNAMDETVSVVGLRWGATLAAMACGERTDVDHVLLWDPIVSGKDYLDEHLGLPRPTEVVGLEGFPFPPALVDGLERLDLRKTLSESTRAEFTALVAEDRPDYREIEAVLAGRNKGELFEVVESSGNWAKADPFGDALIPQRIMQAILDRLTAGVRK